MCARRQLRARLEPIDLALHLHLHLVIVDFVALVVSVVVADVVSGRREPNVNRRLSA